jgi:tetratricopeptide (TPR) repeat protein
MRVEARCVILLLSACVLWCGRGLGFAVLLLEDSLPELPAIVPESFPPHLREKVQNLFEAAAANPRSAEASGKLGMILQAYQNSDQRAEICYRRARLLAPGSFRWAYYLGSVQAARGKHPEAAKTLQEALQLDPEYFPARLKLGDALLASGRADEALRLFKAAVKSQPSSAQAYYGLGRAQSAIKDSAAAVESFRRACELFPYFGAAHYALGLAYKRLGKTEEAQEEFRLYEKNKYDIPGAGDWLLAELNELYISPSYLVELGVDLARQGKLAEAAAEHERALAIDSGMIRAHMNLISLYGRLSQFEEAERHYRAAVRLDPASAESHYNYGVLLMHQGRYGEAEIPLRKALEADPQNPEAHFNLGDVLQRQGKLTEAVPEFRAATVYRPGFAEAHFNLGRLLVNQEKFEEGIDQLLKALGTKDKESDPTYLYALGAAYARARDRDNGVKYIRMAREKAAAQGQTSLQEKIDRDLEKLEAAKTLR